MPRHAFLVASNAKGTDDFSTLNYCRNDIEAISTALSSPKAGYEVVKMPMGSTSQHTLASFEMLASKCESGDTLIFYFSGHGYKTYGSLYLALDKTSVSQPVTTSIPISTVKSIFANSKASMRLLILDCCHSGAAVDSFFKSSLDDNSRDSLAMAAQEASSIVIAACSSFQKAREIESIKMGFLSYLIQQSFTEQFEHADKDGDGLLSVSDFITWSKEQTEIFNDDNPELKLMPPEMYGEFRAGVYLTAEPFGEESQLAKRFEQQILNAVDKIRVEFNAPSKLDTKKLTSLAKPINEVGAALVDLKILDELFRVGDSAAIFAAATILKIRRDPRYMRQLITYIDAPREELRGSANWRVIRAIKFSAKAYDFTPKAIEGIKGRLRRASILRQGVSAKGTYFDRSTTLNMINQLCSTLKIPREEVFSPELMTIYNQEKNIRK